MYIQHAQYEPIRPGCHLMCMKDIKKRRQDTYDYQGSRVEPTHKVRSYNGKHTSWFDY